MTSKEINDMIIGFEKQIEQFGEMITLTNQLNILKSYKQDLERLEVLEQSNNTLAKITGNQLATIHILIEENEKLKKALDVFVKHLQIEWGLQESWLQFRNGDDQSDDLETEEHKLLKEVSENKL